MNQQPPTPDAESLNAPVSAFMGEINDRVKTLLGVAKKRKIASCFSPVKGIDDEKEVVEGDIFGLLTATKRCLLAALDIINGKQEELTLIVANYQAEFVRSQSVIADLTVKIESLSATAPFPSSRSYAEVLSTTVKTAIKDSRAEESRQNQVFVRNLPEDTSKSDLDSLKELCAHIGVVPPQRTYRLRPRVPSQSTGVSPIIVNFNSPEEASNFTRMHNLKKGGSIWATLSNRPNYSKEQEAKYKELWREVIQKNDEAGQKILVVRDLVIVKLRTPGPWTKRAAA